MLPNAAFIGFTGTPLMKTEKSTARKFGGFIHKYTIDQAVKDGAVLPLLYEGRSAKLSINKKQIEKGFERLAKPLSEEAQKDLKRKFSSITKIYESDSVVEEIAYDISQHYTKNWKGTGAKAQLAVPKIDVAIKYQKYFETQTDPSLKINTRVVFTPPDSRKDNDDVWRESSSESRKYWKGILEQFRDQETYETYVTDKSKDSGDTEIEMLIVVSKLLTGFDAPINTLLYLAKPLKGHNLLQAIARVNRLFKGKEYGYIIDYVGILGKLDEASTEYSALEDFDEDDLTNAVSDMTETIRQLPSHHAAVWDIFKTVKNKDDIEALERCIADKDVRDEFYEVLSQFARTLQLCFASDSFYEEYTEQKIGFYKSELKKFQSLRVSVQYRYAEKVSCKEYEPRVKKLLNTYVHAENVYEITKDVNIFDQNMVQEALATYGTTPASKADFIAHRMKKVITENMEKDEAYYKKFSNMIEETITAFQGGRLDEKGYLDRINSIRDDLDKGHQEGIPALVKDKPEARAVFGAITQVLMETHGKQKVSAISEKLAIAGIDITKIIENLKIRDWKKNVDVQNRMENEIEDYFSVAVEKLGLAALNLNGHLEKRLSEKTLPKTNKEKLELLFRLMNFPPLQELTLFYRRYVAKLNKEIEELGTAFTSIEEVKMPEIGMSEALHYSYFQIDHELFKNYGIAGFSKHRELKQFSKDFSKIVSTANAHKDDIKDELICPCCGEKQTISLPKELLQYKLLLENKAMAEKIGLVYFDEFVDNFKNSLADRFGSFFPNLNTVNHPKYIILVEGESEEIAIPILAFRKRFVLSHYNSPRY